MCLKMEYYFKEPITLLFFFYKITTRTSWKKFCILNEMVLFRNFLSLNFFGTPVLLRDLSEISRGEGDGGNRGRVTTF